jgi:hypothetical protein
VKVTKKQFVIIGIITLLVCVGLSGCNQVQPPKEADRIKFVGTWAGHYFPASTGVSIQVDPSAVNWTFFSNGTYWTPKHILHQWNLSGNQLVITQNQTSFTFKYIFTENDTALNLDGQAGVMWLTKQLTLNIS